MLGKAQAHWKRVDGSSHRRRCCSVCPLPSAAFDVHELINCVDSAGGVGCFILALNAAAAKKDMAADAQPTTCAFYQFRCVYVRNTFGKIQKKKVCVCALARISFQSFFILEKEKWDVDEEVVGAARTHCQEPNLG